MPSGSPSPSRLDLVGVSKLFAGVAALSDVSMTLRGGEVHALVGENGAGKSTLINVLAGAFAADAGRLERNGEPLRFASPHEAARQGVAVVHQEPQLVASLTALDNLFIGEAFPRRGITPLIDRGRMQLVAEACCEALGFELPLRRLAGELSATQRSLLALARCMLRDPDWLVLDEPTAALTNRDADRLLAVVDGVRRRGKAVLYVSHRLDEVLRIADRTTVLRNGRRVAGFEAREATRQGLIDAMSGRESSQRSAVEPARQGPRAMSSLANATTTAPVAAAEATLLELRNVGSVDGRVRHATFSVHAGEVLGLYGLAGSGRTELLETLVGLRAVGQGEVRLRGALLQSPRLRARPRRAAALGVVLVPEDRRGQALVMGMRVRENFSLPFLARFRRAGLVARGRERAMTREAMTRLQVKARGPEQCVAELSGGNQQKVVFARALAMAPEVLLCGEPTQGVDIGVRETIHGLLREHRARSGAVLVVSSDLDEVLALADRVVVLRDGATVATLDNRGLDSAVVLQWCFASGPDAAEAPVEAVVAG